MPAGNEEVVEFKDYLSTKKYNPNIFDVHSLWDIVFAYAANNSWFYTLLRCVPPLAEQVPDLAPYASYREKKDGERKEKFRKLTDISKTVKEAEQKCQDDLKVAKKIVENGHDAEVQKAERSLEERKRELEAGRLSDLKTLEDKSQQAYKLNSEAIKREAAEAQNAILAEECISLYSELISMMDEFKRLESKEELSLGPWWKRIKIRTVDISAHAEQGAQAGVCVGEMFGMVLGMAFIFVAPISMPVLSFVCQVFALFFFPIAFGAFIGAILKGSFEITRHEKIKAQDMLDTFSPALVGQFENIKELYKLFGDEDCLIKDGEVSLNDIHADTHTLEQVKSVVNNRHCFFTTLIQSKAAEEQKKLEDVSEVKEANIQPPPDNSLSLG